MVCRTWFFAGELLVNRGVLAGVFQALKECHFLEVYFLMGRQAGVTDDEQGATRAMGRDSRQ
jgi:hypothetical protein